MQEDALSIQHLTKSYGKTVAVDDISLSMREGEFFGFLGPNGAGKTTTIHCVTGIASFSVGNITLFGTDVVFDYRRARTLVGLSPQEFNLDLFATISKALDYVAGYYGMPKRARSRRVEAMLHQFDLMAHRDKSFMELSGGLKRRVMLAKAMIHDPRLLILDEPTAGVDVELRRELWEHLRKLNREGKSILLTSHYLEEVEMLCDRVAIINRGKIVADFSKAEYQKRGRNLEEVYLSITGGKVNEVEV